MANRNYYFVAEEVREGVYEQHSAVLTLESCQAYMKRVQESSDKTFKILAVIQKGVTC